MTTRGTTLDLQNILEQQLSIDEGLHTELDVIHFVDRICESLEEVGYELPEEFSIEQLLKAIEEEVLAEGAVLDEDSWGDVLAGQKKKSFLGRAVGAVKGAVQRGVASAQTKLRRYHSAKADAAMDKAVDPATNPKEAEKASQQHTKHYVKAQALVKKLNPKTHADLTTGKASEFGIKHGSPEDARHRLYFARKLEPLHAAIKATAGLKRRPPPPPQDASISKTASSTKPDQPTDVTKSERPTRKMQGGEDSGSTKAMRILPKHP